MAENLIRGGFSRMFGKRNFEANNNILPTHNPSVKQTFGFFIDANNLYGGIVENFPLPLKNFVLRTEGKLDLHGSLSTTDDPSVG